MHVFASVVTAVDSSFFEIVLWVCYHRTLNVIKRFVDFLENLTAILQPGKLPQLADFEPHTTAPERSVPVLSLLGGCGSDTDGGFSALA